MKTIFQKVKSSMTLQESGIIDKRIKELEKLSNDFISKAYNVDQEKTIEFLKEARIGGYSIIGEFSKRCNAKRSYQQFELIEID